MEGIITSYACDHKKDELYAHIFSVEIKNGSKNKHIFEIESKDKEADIKIGDIVKIR